MSSRGLHEPAHSLHCHGEKSREQIFDLLQMLNLSQFVLLSSTLRRCHCKAYVNVHVLSPAIALVVRFLSAACDCRTNGCDAPISLSRVVFFL